MVCSNDQYVWQPFHPREIQWIYIFCVLASQQKTVSKSSSWKWKEVFFQFFAQKTRKKWKKEKRAESVRRRLQKFQYVNSHKKESESLHKWYFSAETHQLGTRVKFVLWNGWHTHKQCSLFLVRPLCLGLFCSVLCVLHYKTVNGTSLLHHLLYCSISQ